MLRILLFEAATNIQAEKPITHSTKNFLPVKRLQSSPEPGWSLRDPSIQRIRPTEFGFCYLALLFQPGSTANQPAPQLFESDNWLTGEKEPSKRIEISPPSSRHDLHLVHIAHILPSTLDGRKLGRGRPDAVAFDPLLYS